MFHALMLAVALSAAPANQPRPPSTKPAAVMQMTQRHAEERKALAAKQKAERNALREKLKARKAEIKAEIERRLAAEQ